MKRNFASQHPTLPDIAQVLGIQPDTVLEWIIEGRLLIAWQGSQAIMTVDSNQAVKNQTPGRIIILAKRPPNHTWQGFSC